MSKKVRENQLRVIELLSQLTERLRVLIEEGNILDAKLLLADCYEGAIALGTYIETVYGMNTKFVRCLEKYCECLYQTTETLLEEDKVTSAYEVLKEALNSAKDVFDLEFPNRKEMVFMPYKASMWDSLESVWMEANKDPNCDVYVVPIPYYAKETDGSFGEMFYEADLFPSYVPITRYTEYNLEQRRPDVILIHNPYDEYNRVTSVDPQFYSKRLKEYTDKLVYIPYFVIDEEKAAEKVPHYALLPGVINADTVIVQSENVRKHYIEALLKFLGETTENKRILQKKVLGIGSPKYDALQCKHDIPKEWKEIIGDKKVILYNTHLNLIMVNCYERFFVKLRDVLRFFKDREDVVLLWRPHPLMISTAKAMNPGVLEEYLEIVNKYKEEGWGIYDDSPNLNRAIAVSDAYYGSESSVLELYKLTGKPILLHNINITLEQ